MRQWKIGLAQNCVTFNYVLAGVHPPMIGVTEGLWTLEIPDHALGRYIERTGEYPDAAIREAHHNVLRLRSDVLVPDYRFDPDRRFLVKAGDGGFVCTLV